MQKVKLDELYKKIFYAKDIWSDHSSFLILHWLELPFNILVYDWKPYFVYFHWKNSFWFTCVSTESLTWNWLRFLPMCKLILYNFFIFWYFHILFVCFGSFQIHKLVFDSFWHVAGASFSSEFENGWDLFQAATFLLEVASLPFKSSDGLLYISRFLCVAKLFLAEMGLLFWSCSTGVLCDWDNAFTLISHATFPDFSTKWNFYCSFCCSITLVNISMYYTYKLITIPIHINVFKWIKSK